MGIHCSLEESPIDTTNKINLDINGNYVSGQDNTINFRWSNLSTNGSDYPYLELRNNDNSTFIATIVYSAGSYSYTANTNGSGSFTWNGRRQVASLRTISVLPGNYYFRLHFANYLDDAAVNIVANSWDTDGDDNSDAVENENTPATTQITYGSNIYYYNSNDLNSPPTIASPALSGWEKNVGMHDYSLAKGDWTGGTLVNGLRIANSGTGYQYWRGSDVEDTDNWGTLELINLVEKVARKWNASYPNYPVITSMDMSLLGGGPFIVNDIKQHGSHQNGLDVDIRYIRTDNLSEPVDINNTLYSRQRTQELINCFLQVGNVSSIFSADNQLENINYDADHIDHLHIRITDPDGNN